MCKPSIDSGMLSSSSTSVEKSENCFCLGSFTYNVVHKLGKGLLYFSLLYSYNETPQFLHFSA